MEQNNKQPMCEAERDLERKLAARDFLVQHSNMTREAVTQVITGLGTAQHLCHALASRSGWWKDKDAQQPEVFATKIALIHSEVSEMLEGGRKNTMDDHLPHRKTEEVEAADAIIRILDLAGARKLDVAGALIEKLAYNQQRADHTAEGRAAPGGKQF